MHFKQFSKIHKNNTKKRITMIRTIGDLREAIKDLDDDDFIYAVTSFPEKKSLDIWCVQDSTSIGFWEIRLDDSFTTYNQEKNIIELKND